MTDEARAAFAKAETLGHALDEIIYMPNVGYYVAGCTRCDGIFYVSFGQGQSLGHGFDWRCEDRQAELIARVMAHA